MVSCSIPLQVHQLTNTYYYFLSLFIVLVCIGPVMYVWKDSVQYVSMANYNLHKLILKLIPQDKDHPCNAHQTPLSFNLVSLYLSPYLQWPCPLALHSPALLSKHQSEVSQ